MLRRAAPYALACLGALAFLASACAEPVEPPVPDGGHDAGPAHPSDAGEDGGHEDGGHEDGGDAGGATDAGTPELSAGEAIFRSHCAACHTIGRGPTTRGPDLAGVTDRRRSTWLERWLDDPAWAAENTPPGRALVAEWDGRVMPDPGLDAAGIRDVLAFLASQSGPLEPLPPVAVTTGELVSAAETYFDRCAGCHGTGRGGATGPDLTELRAAELGTDLLAAVMRHGTPWGMPGFGTSGRLDEATIARMAAFLQRPAPPPPSLSLPEMRASWELLVPVAERPTAPEHARDWENHFAVVLREAGQVAILDGDTHAEITRIDTGFAVHIVRASSSGRYLYAVGRDGWVTLIDLWSTTPRAVARARGCYDARSVEGSKAEGYEDRYVIEGCYWPSQYVVFDGLTLEPLSSTSVLGTAVDTGEPLAEVRVAAIGASRSAPLWVLALKESGHVALVDYSRPDFGIVARIGAERFLHDGGWDRTGRYFLVAANARNRIAVIDVEERRLVTTIETGALPHPGRGANFLDPTYGWVNATVHLGEGLLSIYGADPVAHPEHAWRVVREIPLPSAGSLFLKTHPSSPWLFVDMTLGTDPAAARQICAYSIERAELDRCWAPSSAHPAVHFEFDRHGTELWVSAWGDTGELVVYDAITLAERHRITGLETPTGKFNVYNTAHDVY